MSAKALTKVGNPYLILCEGFQDRHFIETLLADRQISRFTVCSTWGLVQHSGNTHFQESLDALTGLTDFEDTLRSIIIVADSDSDPETAFRNITAQIAQSEEIAGPPPRRYPVPTAPLRVAYGKPSVAVVLIPWADRPGNLETLLLDAVRAERMDEMECAEMFGACVRASEWDIGPQSKLMLRAYLGANHPPNPEVNLSKLWTKAKIKKLIPIACPAFNQLASYLHGFDATHTALARDTGVLS